MEPVLERRDDAEIAAAAADRPEEVRIALVITGDEHAVGRYHVRRDQIVAGQAVGAAQIAHAAAERETGDACG